MKSWKTILGVAFSAIFLFLAFRAVRLGELIEAFKSTDYLYALPAMLLMIVSLWIRAFRWRFLLSPVKVIGVRSLFYAVGVGSMVNITFPARLGEVVRAHAIGTKEQISRSASFATIVVERVFDGFALLFFLMIPVLFGSLYSPGWLRDAELLAIVGYLVALAVLVFLKSKPDLTMRAAAFVFKPLPAGARTKLLTIAGSFVEGLRIFRRSRSMVISILLSPLVWLPVVALIHCLLIGTGIHLPVQVSFLLLVALCVGVIVPSAPGYVGNTQFVCVGVLKLFGVPAGKALTFSIIYGGCVFVPVLVTGLACLFAEGLSFREIRGIIGMKK
jgi:uncharacterized protein (TIRG00374 family)